MGSSKDIKRQQKKAQKTRNDLLKMIPRVKVRRSTGKRGAGCPCSVLMLAGILGTFVLIGQIL